jgi:formylmethanofuran dehydrogenase subunit D
VTICEIDPVDMRYLGVKENQNVKITTDCGSVVVRAVKSFRAPHRGAVLVPYGPWASILVNPKTHGTGLPSFMGIETIIEPASIEQVLRLQELLQRASFVRQKRELEIELAW